MLVLTTLQSFVKVEKTIERGAKHRKIIHKYFHDIFDVISKYRIHTSVKGSMRIA
jgi:hypothetical protein